jgi:hypothetical protein
MVRDFVWSQLLHRRNEFAELIMVKLGDSTITGLGKFGEGAAGSDRYGGGCQQENQLSWVHAG